MHNKDNDKVNSVIKVAIGAAGLAGATLLTACTFNPFENREPAVYGPPEFDPSVNEEADIYGPPEMLDPNYVDEEEIEQEDIEEDDIEEYDPAMNEEPEIYGPPESFEVDDNVPVCIYGPPEMLEGNQAITDDTNNGINE